MITHTTEMMAENRVNMRGGNGTVKLERWFQPEDFGAKIRLCSRMTLEPGASIGTHTHEHEDELYLVLAGKGRIQENGAWTPIQTGDAILTGKGGSHSVENNSAEPLVIAAIIITY